MNTLLIFDIISLLDRSCKQDYVNGTEFRWRADRANTIRQPRAGNVDYPWRSISPLIACSGVGAVR